jgi:hypothetical protein
VERVTRLSPASPASLLIIQFDPSTGWLVGRKPLEYCVAYSPSGIPVISLWDIVVKLIPCQDVAVIEVIRHFKVAFSSAQDDALRVLVDDVLDVVASLIGSILGFLVLLVLDLFGLDLLAVFFSGRVRDSDSAQHGLWLLVLVEDYFWE